MKKFYLNHRISTGIMTIVIFSVMVLSCGGSGAGKTAAGAKPSQGALDAYIHNNDQSFRWEVASHSQDDKGISCVMDLVSQTWQGIVWKHKMYIIEPAKLTNPSHCLIYITGGSHTSGVRESDVQMAQLIAGLSGMYVAVLWQVPNQPLLGNFDEDGLITETFLKALETKDMSWPLLFPMAKSAIRSMDAVEQLLKKHRNRDLKGFVIFGASKRGWTTWMSAATQDKRIVAIAPMVINTLNMQPQSEYQMTNWGYYSEQIADYYSRNLLVGQIDPKASKEEKDLRDSLWRSIDPYFYRERVTIPKLLVHGTNDRYWNLDATKFYWNDLVGAKYILTLPNVGHNLGSERQKAMTTIAAYAKLISDGGQLPDMKWKIETEADQYTLSVTSNIPAKGAKLWVAIQEGRDFRESKWNATDLQPQPGGNGNFRATVAKPNAGQHAGFYIEIETEYAGIPCSLTTEVFNPFNNK